MSFTPQRQCPNTMHLSKDLRRRRATPRLDSGSSGTVVNDGKRSCVKAHTHVAHIATGLMFYASPSEDLTIEDFLFGQDELSSLNQLMFDLFVKCDLILDAFRFVQGESSSFAPVDVGSFRK